MAEKLNDLRHTGAGGIAFLMSGIGPKPMLNAPDDGGNAGSGDEDAGNKAGQEDPGTGQDDPKKDDKKSGDDSKKVDDGKKPDESDVEREKRELLREVMEKKSRLRELEADKARLENELKKFEGIDLDRVRELLDAERRREEEEMERRGEWERLKERMAEERANERKTLEEQIQAERERADQLARMVDELTVGQQFANSTFIKENLVLTPTKARVLFGKHFEMKDGELVAYDKPAGAANRTPLVDAAGAPLPFDEALKRLVDQDPEKDTLLRAKGAPGAGSRSQQVPLPQKKDVEVRGAARIAAALSRQSK